jgi:hypothetical protein
MDKVKSLWLHGLVAAFVGGFAGAMDSGLVLLLVAPNEFNLGRKLWHTLLAITILAALSGAKVSFAYLKTSPTPESRQVWTDEERAVQLTGKVPDDQAKGQAAGQP